jgi:HK97 family phage prohead protease
MPVADRPMEYTVTHRLGVGGVAERYLRPNPTVEIAQRLLRWTGGGYETCQNCHGRPAMAIRASVPLCSSCRENRGLRLYYRDPVGLAARAASTDDTPALPQLRGHAIVFNAKSVDLGGFIEIIRPAAADRLEAEKPDLRALWNHDSAMPLGRVSAGTLRAKKVTRGVAVEIDPPRWAHGHVESIERRDVQGMSFGFIPIEDDWHLEDGIPHREIFDMDVHEFSPVTFPAYPTTDIKLANPGSRSVWTRERESLDRLRMLR